MTAPKVDVWDDAIRRHDRRVYLSLLALGLSPDRARELAQTTWTRLIEQHAKGKLDELDFPGLAIRQARFLALNELQRSKVEMRVLAAVPDSAPAPEPERVIASRQQLERVLDALATCSPTARKIGAASAASPTIRCRAAMTCRSISRTCPCATRSR